MSRTVFPLGGIQVAKRLLMPPAPWTAPVRPYSDAMHRDSQKWLDFGGDEAPLLEPDIAELFGQAGPSRRFPSTSSSPCGRSRRL